MLTRLTDQPLFPYSLAVVLGGFYCLGFAPIGWWPFTIVAIAGLFLLLNDYEDVNPGMLTWLFGLGKYGVGASWVYVSINVYGGASPPLAIFLVVLFISFAALLFCWPLGWLYGRVRGQSTLVNVVIFGACWALMDWLATWFLTGFPWLYAANGLLDTIFAAWVPILGILGASALLAISAGALSLLLKPEKRLGAGALVFLPWILALGLGSAAWVEPTATHKVALVQGNIDQSLKWRPEQATPNYQRHVDLSEGAWDADLMVWPEAAITMYPQRAQAWLESLTESAIDSQTNLIVGIPGVTAVEDRYEFYNLALGLGLARGRFAKHHLVPFGEYVPFEGVLRGLIEFFDLPMSSMSAGPAGQVGIRTSLGDVAMAICYEVAYPESMRRAAQTAALLGTISNDTWFGASFGPHQHLEIARARALENGRWLVRATNNGLTAIVDHRGEVTAQLPQFEAGTLEGEVQVMQGRTPYGRMGHWPLLVFVLLTLSVALVRRYVVR